jgi:hypothetical protein
MGKAVLYGVLCGFFVWGVSVSIGLKTHIGGDLTAAAMTAASIAQSEERKRHL